MHCALAVFTVNNHANMIVGLAHIAWDRVWNACRSRKDKKNTSSRTSSTASETMSNIAQHTVLLQPQPQFAEQGVGFGNTSSDKSDKTEVCTCVGTLYFGVQTCIIGCCAGCRFLPNYFFRRSTNAFKLSLQVQALQAKQVWMVLQKMRPLHSCSISQKLLRKQTQK